VASLLGLSVIVSYPKTKVMATGYGISEANCAVGDNVEECIDQFCYFGSVISTKSLDDEIEQ